MYLLLYLNPMWPWGNPVRQNCWFGGLCNENNRVIICFSKKKNNPKQTKTPPKTKKSASEQAVTLEVIEVMLVYLGRLHVSFKSMLLNFRKGAGISLSALPS